MTDTLIGEVMASITPRCLAIVCSSASRER
jgi:hypothetical protein